MKKVHDSEPFCFVRVEDLSSKPFGFAQDKVRDGSPRSELPAAGHGVEPRAHSVFTHDEAEIG